MMRRAVASASFLLRKKENIGATLRMHTDRPWAKMAPIGRGRPRGERKSLTGALAFPGYGGRWGNAASHYKRRALPIAKGRSRVERFCAPAPLPKCPHTRKEKISNSEDEIAAGLRHQRNPDDSRTVKDLSGWLRGATVCERLATG